MALNRSGEMQTEEVLGPVNGTTGMMLHSMKEQKQSNMDVKTNKGLHSSSNGARGFNPSQHATRKEPEANEASVNDIGLMSNRQIGLNATIQQGKFRKVYDTHNGKLVS